MKQMGDVGEALCKSYASGSSDVVCDGVAYPLNIKKMKKTMAAMHLDIVEQLRYLHNAERVFSVEHRECIPDVAALIEELQNELGAMTSRRRRTLELMGLWDRTSAPASPGQRREAASPDDDSGASLSVTTGGGLLTYADVSSPAMSSPPATLVSPSGSRTVLSFFLCDSTITLSDVRDLQQGLWHGRLLARCDGKGAGGLLPAAFGIDDKHAPQPMEWLGKNNQLHYLVEHLVRHHYIGCVAGAKWKVAAELFYPHPPQAPYTAKTLSDARKINSDDERRVLDCLPAVWRHNPR